MHFSQGRLQYQINSLSNQVVEGAELPFGEVLSGDRVEKVVHPADICCRKRLYTPAITILLWLFQAIHADKSTAAAVRQFAAWLVRRGRAPCSPETRAYCEARARLSLSAIQQLARETGREVHEDAGHDWLWKGRPIKLVDGTTAIMPDTAENQADYPQPDTQKPGLGFPIVRLVGVFCLATGIMLELAMGRYKGKKQGENSLARNLYDQFTPGDVMLADTYFCGYFDIAMLVQRGVDCVFRLHQCRKIDFRCGQRLGKGDHLVTWKKPARPKWMDWDAYLALPDALTLREVRLRRRTKSGAGKRAKHRKKTAKKNRQLVIVTTLLDPQEVTKADLDRLYRARWQVELDFRNLKTTLGMDRLRCKTPELVRKEIWIHMLAYNLVRSTMAKAAWQHALLPREISFKGACQTLLAFANQTCSRRLYQNVETQILAIIAGSRVADRPGRMEPRAVKRRPKEYPHLHLPRKILKARLEKGLIL